MPIYATSVVAPGKTRFAVTYTDFNTKLEGVSVDSVLNVLADGVFRNKTLTEVRRQPFTHNSRRGLQLTIKTSNGTYQSMNLFVVRNRFYSVFVEAPADSPRSDDFMRFLKSFKVD